MSISKIWEINETGVKSDTSDGFITELVYRVKGIEDEVEKHRVTGSVSFTKPNVLPSEFIAFESVTKDNAMSWVKAALGDQVTDIENDITSKINLINTPVEKIGAPTSWG